MTTYRRVYDSRHLQADCQELGSAPKTYARQSGMGYLYRFYICTGGVGERSIVMSMSVCVCVCVSVCLSESKSPEIRVQSLPIFFVHVVYGSDSARPNMLCTSYIRIYGRCQTARRP